MTRSLSESTRSGRAIAPIAQPRELVIRWRVADRIAARLIRSDEHNTPSISRAVLHLRAQLDSGAIQVWLVTEDRTWELDAVAFGFGSAPDRSTLIHDGPLIHADLPGGVSVTLRDGAAIYARVPAIERLGGGQIEQLDATLTPS